MLFPGALTVLLALAGTTPPPEGAVEVEATAELVVSEDDTVSGTAGMLVGLDETAWDEEAFGPAEDATADVGVTAQDLERLERAVVADLDGVNVEVAARGDSPFGRTGFELTFQDASFETVTTTFERLHADHHLAMRLSLLRQAGESHSAEGTGQQHRLAGTIDAPSFERPAEIDLEVEVTVTFAGLVYSTNGTQDGQTVTWSDTGDIQAIAAPQEEGRPWLLWLLIAVALVLLALRLAQQGNRRTRERHGEIPPRRSEVDGFQPVHR